MCSFSLSMASVIQAIKTQGILNLFAIHSQDFASVLYFWVRGTHTSSVCLSEQENELSWYGRVGVPDIKEDERMLGSINLAFWVHGR